MYVCKHRASISMTIIVPLHARTNIVAHIEHCLFMPFFPLVSFSYVKYCTLYAINFARLIGFILFSILFHCYIIYTFHVRLDMNVYKSYYLCLVIRLVRRHWHRHRQIYDLHGEADFYRLWICASKTAKRKCPYALERDVRKYAKGCVCVCVSDCVSQFPNMLSINSNATVFNIFFSKSEKKNHHCTIKI